jgi:acetyl esterase/lipase
VRSLDKREVDQPPIDHSNIALAPEYPFPTQLRQATAAVQHLLDKGMSPSNITIAGDSAGGNLALQLASVLLHPHPSLPLPPRPDPRGADASPSPSEFQQPFGGLLLISPWVEFATNTPSYVRNSARDVIPASAYQFFADAVQPGVTHALRYHFEPGLAPRDWWTGFGRVFSRVLVTAGEHEMPIDQIQAIAAVITEEEQDTSVFVLPGGVHDDFIDAFASGEGGRGDDYKLVVSWVSKTLNL